MSGTEDQFPPLTPFEDALASIAPRVSGFDREQLLFLAGQASVKGPIRPAARWAWPTAFSLMTAVAAALLVALCTRPDVPVAVRSEPAVAPTVVFAEPAAMEPPLAGWLPQWAPTSRYTRLRDELLRPGVKAERPAASASAEPLAAATPTLGYHRLLEQLLESQSSQRPKRVPSTLD
jgi:hypothetical protein